MNCKSKQISNLNIAYDLMRTFRTNDTISNAENLADFRLNAFELYLALNVKNDWRIYLIKQRVCKLYRYESIMIFIGLRSLIYWPTNVKVFSFELSFIPLNCNVYCLKDCNLDFSACDRCEQCAKDVETGIKTRKVIDRFRWTAIMSG